MEASTIQAPAALARSRIAIGTPLLRLRSDDQLVALFRAGHDEAFAVIHERYQKRLLAYVRQMLPLRQDAEEALQDVFVRAYAGLRSSHDRLLLRPWLFRVAHNRCIDELRRPAPPPSEVLELLRSPMRDPIVLAEQRESLRGLIADVRRLPEQQRSALLMRELAGLSYAELGAALGVSVPAVKSLLVRARVSLAESAQARETDCGEIREEIAAAHDRGARPNATARRHMRDCVGCRSFRREVRGFSRRFAGILPAAGPVAALAHVLGFSGGAGGGATAGGTAAGSGVSLGGGAAAAGGGAAGSGGAAAAAGGGIAAVGATGHVATLIAAAVATAGGAVEIQQTIAPPPPPAHVRHLASRPAPTPAGSPPAWRASAPAAAVESYSPSPPPAATGEAPTAAGSTSTGPAHKRNGRLQPGTGGAMGDPSYASATHGSGGAPTPSDSTASTALLPDPGITGTSSAVPTSGSSTGTQSSSTSGSTSTSTSSSGSSAGTASGSTTSSTTSSSSQSGTSSGSTSSGTGSSGSTTGSGTATTSSGATPSGSPSQ